MKNKVGIIYFSGTGNTEAMAEAVAVGAKQSGAEMKPFCEKLKPYLKGKEMGLFGSCGWSRGAWLNSWYNDLHFAGAHFPAKPVLAYGYPDEEAQQNCEKLGRDVANS